MEILNVNEIVSVCLTPGSRSFDVFVCFNLFMNMRGNVVYLHVGGSFACMFVFMFFLCVLLDVRPRARISLV